MFEDKFDDKILEHIEEKEKFPVFPLPFTVKRAENASLYDISDKKYIDLTSNRENNPFGYSNTIYGNENCFLDSELFSSYDSLTLEEVLKSATGLKKAYYSSNLSDIYAHTNKLINIHLNSTGKEKVLFSSVSADKNLYKIKNIESELIPLNNDSLLKTLFSKSVGAVTIQLVQKIDEIVVAEDEYLREIKNLCDKRNALLVFDASNIAPLRLQKGLFNYNQEIKPDILILSKGIGQGFPISAVLTSDQVAENDFDRSKSGIYSLAYSAAINLIKDFQSDKLNKTINNNIEYINKKFADLSETHISLVDYYSDGMLYTVVVDISAYDFARKAFNKGVILDTLNDNKIIISPPYNIKKDEIDYFISVFDEIFDELAQFDRMK